MTRSGWGSVHAWRLTRGRPGPRDRVGSRPVHRPARDLVRGRPILHAALLLVLAWLLAIPLAAPALAQTATPTPNPDLRITAEPIVGGVARPGEWATFRVHLENDGPAVDGELRIGVTTDSNATFSLPVQLPTGARQEHLLDVQATWSGGRFRIELLDGDERVAQTIVQLRQIDESALTTLVIAEREDRILSDVRAAATTLAGSSPVVAPIAPEDLPLHAETLASVDRIVWQDVAFSRLSPEQLDALRTWVTLGGDLVIVGGTTGLATLEGLPDDLLPYRPDGTVDATPEELGQVLGALPAGATSLPAMAGLLNEGTILAASGDRAIAARAAHGQGSVTLIGFDPAAEWLAGSATARGLWSRMLRPDAALTMQRNNGGFRDNALMAALSFLPSVTLPPMDQLFLLFLAYVVLLGPVTYLVLRRMDRREWAWVVMPALAVIFTAASFALGVALRGTDVIVNELAVVRGAAGADVGLATAYVGIFSPTRTSFDLAMDGALISQSRQDQFSGGSIPFEVQLGDPARLRDFQVGYGSMRAFRASAGVPAPTVESDLRFVDDRIEGTVKNTSGEPLEGVALLYGDGAQLLGDLAPGQVAQVTLSPSGNVRQLMRTLFGTETPTDADTARSMGARMAMIRQLSGEWDWGEPIPGALAGEGPVLLAWRSGGVMDIDIGTPAKRMGEALYLLPLRAEAAGSVTFADAAMRRTLVADSSNGDVGESPFGYYLDRGALTVDYRPSSFEGRLVPTSLVIEAAQGRMATTDETDEAIAPLPPEQQPDQVDPQARVGDAPVDSGHPAIQLFDRVDSRWVELAPLKVGHSYQVEDPERYVDAAGGVLVRFVVRDSPNDSFSLGIRVTGDIE